MNHEDEGRFHINTYDDLVLNPEIELSGTMQLFGKRETVLDVDFKHNKYLKNNIKTWNYFQVGFRQYITKRLNFKLFYSYIPEFYVRHFRDEDWVNIYGYTPEAFTPYIFSKDNYGFWVQQDVFRHTELMFYLYYSQYYHSSNYTEYDSDNLMYRFKLTQRLFRKLSADFTYQFTTSDAKGYDESGESKTLSDDSDATYEEDGFIFGLKWKMPRIKDRYHSLDFETLVYKRYYSTTSSVELDKLHAGRVDDNLRFYLKYYLSVSSSFKFKAYYNWYYRDSGTTSNINEEYVSDEKDYKQYRLGFSLVYKMDL